MKKAYLQIHLSILLWGFTGILGRLIELSEGLLVWYRLLITTVLLFCMLLFSGRLQRFSFKKMWKIMLTGWLVTIHWLFFYGAIKYSNVSVTLACLASTALFTSIFEPLLNRNKNAGFNINPIEIGFALLALAGIYLVFTFMKIYALGIVLALIAAGVGALFTVLNKKLVEQHAAETVSFMELFSGLIFLSALLPLYLKVFPSEKMIPTNSDWMYLFLLSFFCTIIPFIVSLHALKKLSAFTINLALNLEPVYGIILAIFVFREDKSLGWGFFAGTGLIMASVFFHSVYDFTKRRLMFTKKNIPDLSLRE